MEIYDNHSSTSQGSRTHDVIERTPSVALAIPAGDASGYWKFCSIVLGVALLIALVLGRGPESVGASETTHWSTGSDEPYTHPALIEPVLRIGGFDTIEDVPVFVMVDQTGQRVGVMEMPAKSKD